MASEWWEDTKNLTNLTGEECPPDMVVPNSRWTYTIFGECVYNKMQYAAFFIGLSSIMFWLVAQAPQLVTNCRYGIADKALSFWFLLLWFTGDATNLVGAILTKQLATQIATAVYFVCIDSLMMVQFLYYVIKNQGTRGLVTCLQCPRESAVLILLPGIMCTLLLSAGGFPHWSGGSYTTEHRMGRVLLRQHEPVLLTDVRDILGYIIGCISAVLYVGSRVPQIVKNFTRCSVEGVSLTMFIMAVLGNVTYALGIFLYSVETVFILRKLPWLVGSVGTLFFDFTIFSQFLFIKVFGCGQRQREKHDQDPERRPLLQPSANGIPCFDKKGSIQGSSGGPTPREETGEEAEEIVTSVVTSYYSLPS